MQKYTLLTHVDNCANRTRLEKICICNVRQLFKDEVSVVTIALQQQMKALGLL